MSDNYAASKEVLALRKALLPFAQAASDYEPPRFERTWQDNEHIALSLTVGQLREARRVLMEIEG